jgi:hypothetical protein
MTRASNNTPDSGSHENLDPGVHARAHAAPHGRDNDRDRPGPNIEPSPPTTEQVIRAVDIAMSTDILGEVREEIARAGYAGDPRTVLLVFLVVVSRLLPRPASIAIKAQSSAGKNATVEAALRFFPPEAFFARTNLSAKALYYSSEPFAHRTFVLFEGHMLKDGDIAAIVRSLLSEGRLVYEVTDFESFGTRLIEKTGPTNLITTTTLVNLDRELETRMLSDRIPDDADMTRAIMRVQAAEFAGETTTVDFVPWHLLSRHLAEVTTTPVVPFAKELAELIDGSAVRMRRDFRSIMALICAHALLHEATRERSTSGNIIATLADYAGVHGLINAVVAEGVALSVSPKIRATVEAVVARLAMNSTNDLSIADLAKALGIHESNARRRAYECFAAGFLHNLSPKGRPIRIVSGERLPDDVTAMPSPEELAAACARARTGREG